MSRETETQKTADYIQPDRRTEIKRLTARKDIALIVWPGGTWLVFMYVWVFALGEPTDAFMASILPAIIGAFYYFNERRTVNPQIKRLMKYELLFDEFFEAMIRDMERNDAEKGDSWLNMNFGLLNSLRLNKWGQIHNALSCDELHLAQEPKLANYSAMIYLRRKLG